MRRSQELSAPPGVWVWIVGASLFLVFAVGRLTAYAPEPRTGLWPLVVVGLGTFLVQSFPIHITSSAGRHSVVLTEVMLAIGLFIAEPVMLVLGMIVGAVPALLRLRPTPAKLLVNTLQSGLWVALPAWMFHASVPSVEPTATVIGVAFASCLVAFLGASLSVRVPIGLATGQWGFEPVELRHMLASAVTALGAAALALVGVLLWELSAPLVLLLTLPVVQIMMATAQQARSADRRTALDFTVEAAQLLRQADDVPTMLRQLLPGFRRAFAVDEALLLLSVPGAEIRRHCSDDGEHEDLPAEGVLRAWLAGQATDGPMTMRRDPGLEPLGLELGARELLVAPLLVERGMGAIVLAGRPLGPFRSDHVELLRTCVAATSSALDRHTISKELDAAETRGVELERRASHDEMTSLANKARFEHALEGALASGRPCSLLFIDLDGFKEVNDTFGHAVGDAVLVAAATRIGHSVRAGDLAARIGGDEFAILVHDQGAFDAVAVGRRVLADFVAPVPGAPGVTAIRAAIGVAESRPGDTTTDLLERADAAMYVAKRAGGHRVEIGV